jgi:hypothetical protein
MAPAASENSMIGRVFEVCTSATRSADPASAVMSHAAPTDWMSPPKLEDRLASHTARKIPCSSGAKGEERLAEVFSVGTAASSRVEGGWRPRPRT